MCACIASHTRSLARGGLVPPFLARDTGRGTKSRVPSDAAFDTLAGHKLLARRAWEAQRLARRGSFAALALLALGTPALARVSARETVETRLRATLCCLVAKLAHGAGIALGLAGRALSGAVRSFVALLARFVVDCFRCRRVPATAARATGVLFVQSIRSRTAVRAGRSTGHRVLPCFTVDALPGFFLFLSDVSPGKPHWM